MDTLRELTAAELRATLARRRISAAELARRLGWSQAYMARRVDGRIALNMDDLDKIRAELGISLDDLLPREVGRPNDRSAPGRPAPHAVDIRSPNVAGTRRRPKARQPADPRLIAA